MTTQSQEKQKNYHSIILSAILFLAVIVVLLISRNNPNTFGLGRVIICYLVVIVGSIVAFILSFKAKKNVGLFTASIVASSTLFIVVSIFTFLLAVANGISEP